MQLPKELAADNIQQIVLPLPPAHSEMYITSIEYLHTKAE